MRATYLIPFSGVSLGAKGIDWFGFIEIRWRGGEIMLAGHPIDPFFFEAGSIFLIIFGIFTAALLLPRALFGHLKSVVLRELDELQECGEEMMDWASSPQPQMQSAPRAKIRLRHLKLMEKYRGG